MLHVLFLVTKNENVGMISMLAVTSCELLLSIKSKNELLFIMLATCMPSVLILQCIDAVGWAAGRVSGL